MADHASVIHSFVSPIADLPGSLVKPSDWNHGHIFQGGVDGDLLTKDSTQTDGVLFKSVLNSVNGRILSLTRGQGSVASSPSPTGDFLIIPFTLVKTNSCVLVLTQAFMTDTNNTYHVGNIFVLVDNTLVSTQAISTLGDPTLFIAAIFTNLSSGAHDVRGHFTSSSTPIAGTILFYILEIDIVPTIVS